MDDVGMFDLKTIVEVVFAIVIVFTAIYLIVVLSSFTLEIVIDIKKSLNNAKERKDIEK